MIRTLSRPSRISWMIAGILLSFVATTFSNAAGLDDGYPPGEAAPGRTCLSDALGQKTVSSYSGKALSCILINSVATWWVDGDPLPAIPAPTSSASAPTGVKPPGAVATSTAYLWEKSASSAKAKGSKFITIAGDRPAQVLIPGTMKPKVAAPLIVALHGFMASPSDLISLMDLSTEAYKRSVVLAIPSGTRNNDGFPFWNATGSCCDFNKSGVDDAKYLMDLVKAISAKVAIDQKRIYFVGHSNGGFMSYTLACQNSEKIAAIVSIEGSTFADSTLCNAKSPVSILQVNGTADELIHIAGGNVFDDSKQPYPSVKDEQSYWAGIDGCSALATSSAQKFNYESAIPGSETSKASYKCPKGLAVESWTISAGHHVPKFNANFISAIFDFLLAHKK